MKLIFAEQFHVLFTSRCLEYVALHILARVTFSIVTMWLSHIS
jgi:hypothetical protein